MKIFTVTILWCMLAIAQTPQQAKVGGFYWPTGTSDRTSQVFANQPAGLGGTWLGPASNRYTKDVNNAVRKGKYFSSTNSNTGITTYYYHLGFDILNASDSTDPNHPVYAISDGQIVLVTRGADGNAQDAWGKSGWGNTACSEIEQFTHVLPEACALFARAGNVGLVIKHRMSDGSFFYAIYGHLIDANFVPRDMPNNSGKQQTIGNVECTDQLSNDASNMPPASQSLIGKKRPFRPCDIVLAGEQIGVIGDWPSGRHLHFSVAPYSMPRKPLGLKGYTNTDWPDDPAHSNCIASDGTQHNCLPTGNLASDGTYFNQVNPIDWITTQMPSNWIHDRGTQMTSPKVGQASVPPSVTIPQGGIGQVPFTLQSLLNFMGTAQGNAITTPSSLLSFSDRPKVLGINETVPTQSLIYVPNFVPIGTYPVKVQTTFQDNSGNVGATPEAAMSIQVVEPPIPSGSGSAELFGSSLYSDPSLQAYYRFEGNANDSKGPYHGTNAGATYSTATGKFGQGAGFNGGGSYQDLGNGPAYSNQMTVSLWFMVSGGSGRRAILTKAGDGGYWESGEYDITVDSSNTLSAEFNLESGAYGNVVSVQGPVLATGVWNHIALAVDRANSVIKLYFNGSLYSSVAMNTNARVTNRHLYVGKFYFNTINGFFWNGGIDDLSFFSRTLSAAEIASLANGGGVGSSGGTVNVTVSGYSSNVSCTLNGSNITAPTSLSNQLVGTYQLSCSAPNGYSISSIAPSSAQALTEGGVLNFTVNLTANTSPLVGSCIVNGQSSPLTLQVGNQATYLVTTSGGTGNKNYVWYNIPGNNSNSASRIYNTAGTYNVYAVVSDSAQVPQQLTVNCPQITVQSPPAVSAYCSFSPGTITLGNGSTMTAGAISGTSPYTFMFPGSGSYVSGNTALIMPTSRGVLTYQVTVKDSLNQTNTASCQITVN